MPCGVSDAPEDLGRSARRRWCAIGHLDECPRILVVGVRGGRKQGGVLSEDRSLQRSQLLGRFDAVAADERLAGVAVGSECFDLPTGKVERPHLQRKELFMVGVVADECFQLANDCLCRTLFDVGFDPIAERRQVKLVPSAGGIANDGDVVEVDERFATPEAQRLAEYAAGFVVLRRSQRPVTAFCQVAEPLNVKCRGWHGDDVAALPGGDLDFQSEQATQPRDVALERLDRLGGWPPIPQILD